MDLYYVINFVQDSSMAVVPKNWIFDIREDKMCKCYWPNGQSLNVNKMAKNNVNPEIDWKIYSAKIFYQSSSYEKSHHMMNKFTDDSEPFSDDCNKSKKSRYQRHAKSLQTSDEESSDVFLKKKNISCIPSPPVILLSPPKVNDFVESTITLLDLDTNESNTFLNTSKSSLDRSCNSNCANSENAIESISQKNSCIESISLCMDNNFIGNQKLCSTTQDSNIKFEKSVLNKMYEQDQKLNTIINIVTDILEIIKNNNQQPTQQNILGDFVLPINSVEEMYNFEKQLSIHETKEALTRILSMCGGTDVKDNVARVMRRLMTTAVAVNMNWKGRAPKIGFSKLVLSEVVKSSIHSSIQTTDSYIEAEIKKWLKFAKDRDGGRSKRK